MPYTEGGLAIKNLGEWNQALMLYHLWKLINPFSTSLSTVWIKNVKLKNKSVWTVKTPHDCSWTWKKVLKLRDVAMQYANYQIGNADSISLWFDPWLHSRPLATSASSTLIINSALGPYAKVSSIIDNSAWILPQSNHNDVITFRNSFDFSRICNSRLPDSVTWDSVSANAVTATSIWQCINQALKVQWCNIPRHKVLTPRFSFHLWLIFHISLRTKDKLLKFGIYVDPICVLCNVVERETANHLYFNCLVSFRILLSVMRQCGWKGSNRCWQGLINFILYRADQKMHHMVLILGLAAVVQSIWTERNARLHGNPPNPIRAVIQDALNAIKCKLHSYRKSKE